MLIWFFRAIFSIVLLAVLIANLSSDEIAGSEDKWAVLWSSLGMAVFVLFLDILTPKKKLSALAGVFFGLLVGMLLSLALAPAVKMITESYGIDLIPEAINAIKWMMSICICYLTISIVMRTKDDVRFVVPYVEFAKQSKGARPLILDTSAIIDGRVADLCESKLFDAPVVIPRFVLNELQLIADSADKLKRTRGRRGLDILNQMQSSTVIDVEICLPRAATGVWQRRIITSPRWHRCVRSMWSISTI
ncbi:MAG: hypothetical protein ACYS32_14645 [Planctomycetota bacterium]|jgi:uncharacterized protein YacL